MFQQNWLMLAKLSLAVVAVLLPRLEAAAAHGARYEIFPEPQVRQSEKYRVNSAHVVDKKESQFWICTARYHHHSGEANQGECTRLPAEVGRPTLTENHTIGAVIGTAAHSPLHPVLWFIDQRSGDIQFCALRSVGICVSMRPE